MEICRHLKNMHSKTCVKRPLSKRRKLVFKTKYRLMQVKSIADSAILWTFIKLPINIKIFVLSIFEWPFYTGFTVVASSLTLNVIMGWSIVNIEGSQVIISK